MTKSEITKEEITIYVKKCKFCGKEIKSQYKTQLEFNHQIHESCCIMNPESKKSLKTAEKIQNKSMPIDL